MSTNKKNLIITLEKEISNAMKNCDVHKLDELLHKDLLFTIPNGQTITKDIDLETYSTGNMKITEITTTEQKINIIGDNAVASKIVEMKGMYFGHPLDGRYRIMRVWKLSNNKWQVIAGSSIQF